MADVSTLDKDYGMEDPVYLEFKGHGRYVEIFLSSASETHQANILGSPGEKGMMNFDNKVRMPIVVHLDGVVTKNGYATIKKFVKLQSAGKIEEAMCVFYGRDGESVESLFPTQVRVTASSERLNMVSVSIELKEFMRANS